MQAVLGLTFLKQLKPAAKPFEVRDAKLRGLLLRVQPSGVMTYYVQYGRGKRIKVGRADVITPDQARARAKEIFAAAYVGEDPGAARRRKKVSSLREFIDYEYEPWAKVHLRTGSETVARIRATFSEFLDKRLADITALMVDRWRSGRLEAGRQPTTVNRDLDDLRAALSKAVAWKLVSVNPLDEVKRLRVDKRRSPRFLSEDEERRLRRALDAREERIRRERDSANEWRAARGHELLPNLRQVAFADHLKVMVIVSLNTGLRRGELFRLDWEDVNLDGKVLTVRGTNAKSGSTRHIPLNQEAQSVLTGWRAQAGKNPTGPVFPSKNGSTFDNVRKSWHGVLEDAGIDGFRWHDLRHSFASKLAMRGVDLNSIRELLGHSDLKMTLIYSHLSPSHKAAAVETLVR